jgi:hypothetical protein
MLELARDYHVIVMAATAQKTRTCAAPSRTIGHLARGFRRLKAVPRHLRRGRRSGGGAPGGTMPAPATSALLRSALILRPAITLCTVDHGIGAFVGLKQLAVAPGEPPQESGAALRR